MMMGSGSHNSRWGTRALDTVEAIEAAKEPAEVAALFNTVITECGFHAYFMAGLPPPDQSLSDLVVANGWHPEWFELYTRERFVEVDPIPLYCKQTTRAFEWREAPYDRDNNPAARAVMDRALDFRMFEGLCIPIHYDDGTSAAVSIAGEHVDVGGGAKPALHLVGLYAHNRLRSMLRGPQKSRKPLLSPREREVLRWTALGKTSWEIGEILNISERTVNAHIQSAACKMNAVNRVALVVSALRGREINL
jgi:LuxR family quorum sensing-dependent transcriptional regulator